jgi:hypothetical protein
MALDNDFFRPYLLKKWCWDNGFFVVIKPITKGGYKSKVKIHLVIQKNTQVGKEEYAQNSKELENKIEELYKYMYETYR